AIAAPPTAPTAPTPRTVRTVRRTRSALVRCWHFEGSSAAARAEHLPRALVYPRGHPLFPFGISRRTHDTPHFAFVPPRFARSGRSCRRARGGCVRRGGLRQETRAAGGARGRQGGRRRRKGGGEDRGRGREGVREDRRRRRETGRQAGSGVRGCRQVGAGGGHQ